MAAAEVVVVVAVAVVMGVVAVSVVEVAAMAVEAVAVALAAAAESTHATRKRWKAAMFPDEEADDGEAASRPVSLSLSPPFRFFF